MAKYIDADALKDAVEDWFGEDYGFVVKDVNYIINEMPAADVERVRRWISVKDRLPEGDGKYICMDSHENIFDAIFYDWGKEFGYEIDEYDPDTLGFTDTEWHKYEDVEYWMKIPEPQKMDGGSE